MTKKLLFVVVIALALVSVALAADPSGKWTFEMQGMGRGGGGGNPVTSTMTLKADGAKLTGNISRPGRGGDPMVTEISEGKIDGDNITFKTVQTFGDQSMTTSYKGTVKGDTIELEIQRPGRGGAEAPAPVKVTAKKATT
jgi:hypothetical protein